MLAGKRFRSPQDTIQQTSAIVEITAMGRRQSLFHSDTSVGHFPNPVVRRVLVYNIPLAEPAIRKSRGVGIDVPSVAAHKRNRNMIRQWRVNSRPLSKFQAFEAIRL